MNFHLKHYEIPQPSACYYYYLREELKKATHALSQAMAVKTTEDGIDFGAESPLNLFIQCFKEKYGLVVNPNDVAIFV